MARAFWAIVICLLSVAGITTVFAANKRRRLCINEIMQSNINTVFVDMDFPDSWAELYNPADEDISINQFYISLSSDYREGYRIETTETVPAGGYALIYLDKEATGKHASFRLNSDESGKLFLFNNYGVLLDSVSHPAMPAPNIAYARGADNVWHYVTKATPNAPNTGEPSNILLPHPSFSSHGQVLAVRRNLTISIPKGKSLPQDTRLYLTFNGSEPDTSSICVSGRDTTFVIAKTTVVRARLISAHALCPPSHTESFICHPRFTDIPIISLAINSPYLYSDSIGIFSSDTLPGLIKPNYAYNWRRPLNMEYLGSFGNTSLFNQWGETGMYGSSTRSHKQKSMKLISNKRFGTKHLKGRFWPNTKPKMKKVKAMCLRSAISGNRLMEGILQNWFGAHMPDLDYQAFSPAIVYINGEYKGFMGLREKADEDYVWANYGGLEDIEMIENLNASQPVSFKAIRDAIYSDEASYEEIEEHFDMDNMADMIAINMICGNTDWPYNNAFMWRPVKGGGKWRWIMKDMDMINVAFRCTNPLTFNYLKYLTNTGEPGSQESDMHLSAEWIWPRIKLLGKLINMPQFRDALVDRLIVFMGDFMRGDVLQSYLEEQFEELDEEVTPSLLMLKTGSKNTFHKTIQSYVSFFYERPKEVYRHTADFYHLGSVIPMKTVGNGLPVSINDIPLTEGDFNGACFSNRAIRLNSGDKHVGWIVHVKGADNIVNSYGIESPAINVIPRDIDDNISSIKFEACAIKHIPVSIGTQPQQLSKEIDGIYSLDGRNSPAHSKSPRIIHYTDGTSKKVWQNK